MKPDPVLIEWEPSTRATRSPWAHDEDPLWLLKPEELPEVPDGAELTCISGEVFTKGVDRIDGDTRAGLLAYGLRESQLVLLHEGTV
jgi:hypothetical protein